MFRLRLSHVVSIAPGPVVLDTPYPTQNAIFLGDKKTVIQLDRKTLKPIRRVKTKLQVRGGFGSVVLLYYYDEFQAWNENGQLLWSRKVQSQPARRDDRLYLLDAGLVVLDLASGSVLDRFANCPSGFPSLLDDGVLVADPERTDPVRLYGFAERRVLWEKSLLEEIRDRFQVNDRHPTLSFAGGSVGRVVMERGRHLFGMSVPSGDFLWAIPLHISYFVPQIRDARIYAWTTGPGASSTRVTMDLGSGQAIRERSEPAAGDNHFVIVDEVSGEIVVDRPLAAYGAAFEHFQEPYRGTLCKNHIVFTTRSGLIAVFRLSDGELVWQHQHGDQLFYPVFEDNLLYVTCADGTLVVFEAEGGEL